MQSKAATVHAYLLSLPEDRRAAISSVRDVILKNLDPSYEEGMQYGMIGYYVPHRVYPKGYHCDPKRPLPFAALGSQKNYMSLHLMSVYSGSAAAPVIRMPSGFAKPARRPGRIWTSARLAYGSRSLTIFLWT